MWLWVYFNKNSYGGKKFKNKKEKSIINNANMLTANKQFVAANNVFAGVFSIVISEGLLGTNYK